MSDEAEYAAVETPPETDGGEQEPVRRPVLQGTKGIDTAQVWMSGFLIVVVGMITFSNVLPIPWQGEDADLIASNVPLHALRTFPEAVDPENPRALTMLTFALNWRLTPGSAGAFHAVNVLLHLANAVLVFLLCRALFGKAVSPVVAMLAGMLFVAHPLASESVDYIVGRAGLLSTFFVLISLNTFVRGTEGNGSAWAIALSVLAFVLAVAADASAWVLPLLVLVMDRTLRGKFGVMKHLGLHAVYWGVLIAFWAIDFARPDLSANAGAGRLALMTVAPAGLSAVHAASDSSLGGFLVVAIAFAGVPLVLYRSVAGLSLFWFGLALLTGAPSERGAYLALAGAALLAPWLLSRARPKPVRVAVGLIAAVAVLACGVTTYRRGLMWQNSIELWTDAAEKAPDSPMPPRNLGRAFLRLTNMVNAREVTATAGAQAEEQFRRAMALGYDEPDVVAGLGEALAKQGKTNEALAVYQDALRKDPANRDWTLHAADLFLRRANTGGGEDDRVAAVEYFAKANRVAPLTGRALAAYGAALYSVGDFEAAASLLAGVVDSADEESQLGAMLKHAKGMAAQIKRMEEEAVKLLQADPNDVTALKMRAQVLVLRGRYVEASYVLDELRRRNVDDFSAWILAGLVRARMDGAVHFVQEWGTPPTKPADIPLAWPVLAQTCAGSGLWDAAEAYLQSVPALAEGGEGPLTVLGELALRTRQIPRAKTYLERAVKAYPESPAPWLLLSDVAAASRDLDRIRQCLAEAEKRGAAEEDVSGRKKQYGIVSSGDAGARTVIR